MRRKTHEPVNCQDDAMMVREHLRQPEVVPILQRKLSQEERRQLKVAKSNCSPTSKKEMGKVNRGTLIPMKLTLYFDNVKKEPNFKTTLSTSIFQENIPEFIEALKHQGLLVKKGYFNGKSLKL